MLPPVAERPKLRTTLNQLASTIEELLLGGLTTANDATRQTLTTALQEAARFRLLRLGAVLRVLADDLGRFRANDPLVSRRRLTLFLNRGWLIARGLFHALETNDEAEFDRLNFTPTTQPLSEVAVVCLGIVKRATASVVRFEFRCRVLSGSTPVQPGESIYWAFTQAVKSKAIPPEAYLHLAQKQKFTPYSFLEKKVQTIRNAQISADDAGAWRVTLDDTSTVTPGEPFVEWSQFANWSPVGAIARLKKMRPGPLDLETELLEEVLLDHYTIGASEPAEEPGQIVYPLQAGAWPFHAIVNTGTEGQSLKKQMEELRKTKKDRPPMFGLMHYERCRLVLQPLATITASGPDYLTISNEKIDKAALLKSLF